MGETRFSRLVFFEEALRRLEEALSKPEDPIVRDACIQRFEFTFEMAWKAVQTYAMAEGVECVSPRDCFRTAFRLVLVESDARWMAMVEDRNRTAHTYDEDSAKTIYRALPGYANLLRHLVKKLKAGEMRRAQEET
jgi:nucleotidyltransferase substrate binding protein (TIGR01987 family)